MKLIVQIPCLNEEHTLTQTVKDIPRNIPGVDMVEILVVDDGSTDNTIAIARSLGVDHIIENKRNIGLARSFRRGLDACLKNGADIIVNTDGDNQYAGQDIPKLIAPILSGTADLVVGDRGTSKLEAFSPLKRVLQYMGSTVVRNLSGVDVPDAVSGFRAISREGALRINIVSSFSYTTEMLIQAGKKHMAVASVPIGTNEKTRESRLFKGTLEFILRQVTTIIRMYAMYQPLRVFFWIGTVLSVVGLVPIVRFLWVYLTYGEAGFIQSVVLGGVLMLMGFFAFLIGLVADLINFNRQLIEIGLEKTREMELSAYSDEE
ncbi:MAG: glycosyltransferase family 2 protein [Gammaproteobacteria bacterium]|nr:glycosyltransferase family 2 protein [Gammaproteobacteria bacterium]